MDGMATKIAKNLGHSYFLRGNKLATALKRLTAVQHFYRMAGIILTMQHHYVRSAVIPGIDRVKSTLKGGGEKVRRFIEHC